MNFPNKKYEIIYTDPPWQYGYSRVGRGYKHSASAKYPTMSLKQICSLDIGSLSEKNSVLFLWVTVPMMQEGFQVMTAWGFKYKTMITWRKEINGMGYWFRGQTEHLLLGVRGNIKAFHCQLPNFIETRALRHSEKPEETRRLIETACPNLDPRIELFARRRSEGWDTWGNQIDNEPDLFLVDQ